MAIEGNLFRATGRHSRRQQLCELPLAPGGRESLIAT